MTRGKNSKKVKVPFNSQGTVKHKDNRENYEGKYNTTLLRPVEIKFKGPEKYFYITRICRELYTWEKLAENLIIASTKREILVIRDLLYWSKMGNKL